MYGNFFDTCVLRARINAGIYFPFDIPTEKTSIESVSVVTMYHACMHACMHTYIHTYVFLKSGGLT